MQGRRREQGWCVFVSFSFKFEIWGGGGGGGGRWLEQGWLAHSPDFSPLPCSDSPRAQMCLPLKPRGQVV